MKRAFLVAALFSALLSSASTSQAAVRYTYTGNNYTVVNLPYTTSMHLSGWFEMNSAMPPNTPWPTDVSNAITNYSFFDGVNTLTESNSGFFTAVLATDALGNITQWEINLSSPVPAAINTPVDIITTNNGSDYVDADANCVDVSDGICQGVSQLNGASSIISGTWAMQIVPDSPVLVPTMSEWGKIIFIFLAWVCSVGYLRAGRKGIRA